MNEKKADFWGISKRLSYKDNFGKIVNTYLENYFLVIKGNMFYSGDFDEYINLDNESGSPDRFTVFFQEKGYIFDTYLNTENNTSSTYNFDTMLYAPYDMLKKYRAIVVKKEVFENEKLKSFDYHLGNQIIEAFNFIKDRTDYNIDFLWQYLLKKCNISRLRQNLNLTYVINENQIENYEAINKKMAVFAHIFYRDLIDECFFYLENIPKNMDIFITVCNEEAKEYMESRFEAINMTNYKVLIAGNRGRDLAALLITFGPYIKEYEYICFLHDKKTTGANGFTTIGSTFMNIVWDNLLKSTEYIENIIDMFENDKSLGFLAPPIPYHSGYIRLLGDAWTVCYNETKKLAENLNLSVDISKEFHPFALSTSFWCKTEALKPLLDYKFKIKDFPEEPMELDGTFSHALERILIYVAQEMGYYSAIICNQKYASLNLSNMEYLLSKNIKDSIATFGTQGILDMFSGTNYKERISLIKYIMSNKRVCIYGQGNNGKNIADFFENQGFMFEYFLVSDGKSIKRNSYGYEAFYFSEKLEELKDIGIIIAVDKLYRNEIIENLLKYEFTNYFIAT